MPELAEVLAPIQVRLEAAPDEEKPGIQLELAQAEGNWYKDQIAQRDIDSWKTGATGKYPRAIASMISGATQEEIEASAKASHEAVQAQVDAAVAAAAVPPPAAPPAAPAVDPQAAAAAAYGQPTGSAGPPPVAGEIAELDNIHKGLREAYPGNRNGPTPPKPGSRNAGGKASKILNELGDEDRITELRLGPVFDQMVNNASNKAPGRVPASQ